MKLSLVVLGALALAAIPAAAAVTLSSPTVQAKAGARGQAFALGTLTADSPDQVVGASSPAAAMAHVHLTRRGAGGVMRSTDAIPLAAGKPRTLSVHGYHVMLMGLRAPLKVGDVVPVTITFAHSAPVTADFAVTR